MTVQLDREDRIERQVEKPNRRGLAPPAGRHSHQPTPLYALTGTRPAATDIHAKRILFVEDDRFIAEMYRMKLEGDGWKVELAYDGEAALATALADPPALILLDVL